MGVKVEDFLYDYFSLEQLKEALYDIGIPAGKTKKECVDKILEKWITYNRSWYDLLNFLDTEDLENICEHFKIEYTDWDSEESLMDKIEENWVLDFRIKQKKKMSKNSKSSAIHIDNQNIHIGDNKINSDNITNISSDNSIKINSDNSFYSNLSDNKKRMFVVGVITIIVMIGIAMYQGYESTMEDWETPTKITEQALAEILKSGDVEEFNKNKRAWVGELNFDGINLSKMDLTEVNLQDTSLQRSVFDNSILITAFFEGADLEKASFRNANLERADLVEANLKNAFLRGADLEMANLNRADMENADLYGSNLRHASLIKTNLQNADLQQAEFYWANLEDANLDGALLNNTDFRESQNLPISLNEARTRSAEVD